MKGIALWKIVEFNTLMRYNEKKSDNRGHEVC